MKDDWKFMWKTEENIGFFKRLSPNINPCPYFKKKWVYVSGEYLPDT